MDRHGRVRVAYFSHREAGKGIGNKHDQAIVIILSSINVSQPRFLLGLEGIDVLHLPKETAQPGSPASMHYNRLS